MLYYNVTYVAPGEAAVQVCHAHKDCVSEALLNAEAVCRDREARFTKLRRKVLRLIWASHRPAKAYDILKKLGVGTAGAKPPTVYRALDFLLVNGLAHRLNSLNAYVGCSHPLQHDECYFLFCSTCGEIEECCSGELKRAIRKATGRNQFEPRHTTLEIEGKCRECRRGEA